MATNASERQLDVVYLLMEMFIATNCRAQNAEPEYDRSLDLNHQFTENTEDRETWGCNEQNSNRGKL